MWGYSGGFLPQHPNSGNTANKNDLTQVRCSRCHSKNLRFRVIYTDDLDGVNYDEENDVSHFVNADPADEVYVWGWCCRNCQAEEQFKKRGFVRARLGSKFGNKSVIRKWKVDPDKLSNTDCANIAKEAERKKREDRYK